MAFQTSTEVWGKRSILAGTRDKNNVIPNGYCGREKTIQIPVSSTFNVLEHTREICQVPPIRGHFITQITRSSTIKYFVNL